MFVVTMGGRAPPWNSSGVAVATLRAIGSAHGHPRPLLWVEVVGYPLYFLFFIFFNELKKEGRGGLVIWLNSSVLLPN